MRTVLAIPLEEVSEQFVLNTRQDVKIVAPEMLASELIAKLTATGRLLKPEQLLEGETWKHSASDASNALCESHEFSSGITPESSGPFALCFGNEKGAQDAHYHPHHLEIYVSEHPLEAEYRLDVNSPVEHVRLEKGGVLIFSAGVIHRARLGGLTVVIEIPAVKDDKVIAEL
jgi:quercetin dioxygenase-like cupin family protein